MGKSTVVIRCEVLRQKDGGNSGRDYDCKNNLLYLIGAKTFFVVLQCLGTIHKQRVPAHMAGRNAQGSKVLQTLIPGRDGCLIEFRIGIADASPHILAWCLCDDLRVNEGMHDRTHKKVWLQEGAIVIVHDRHRGTCCTVRCDRREREHRLVICDA